MRKMHYKDYEGSIEFSKEDNVFHGIILGIGGTVTFEADTLEDLPNAFHESVEDYIELCKEMGWEPQKSHQVMPKRSKPARTSRPHNPRSRA